ncbi:MAG TPA: SDR family oxidoreductase [Ramlibacter sp.]|uniref:SDR family NAD(P)-dependent oxidoreductase n=1 Tax=Ramlibacter sp. TaxID=1917967 RepID=UPI002ED23867
MDLQLSGRHVLVTGGSKGIGRACAEAFLAEGAVVSLVARDAAALDEATARLRALHPGARVAGFAANLRDPAAARAALDAAEAAHGPLDVLVNCAGAAKRTPPAELDAQAWHEAMEAKYFAYVHMMDPAVKRMGERRSGAIVNVIGAGGKVANPTHLAGGAANAALMLVTAGLASAYAGRGVRINAINPAQVLTERLRARLDAEARLAASEGRPAPGAPGEKLPMGRPAAPEEIANVAVFLASPRASYVNGAIVAVDGASTPMVV